MIGVKKFLVSIGKDMNQREFSYIASRNAKWYSYLDKWVSICLLISTLSSIPCRGVEDKKNEPWYFQVHIIQQIFTVFLF